MFSIISFVALAQPVSASDVAWPSVRPGRIVATPDWSDYRIYPAAARRKNEEGRVLPELLVGTDGKPQACRIVTSSNFPELDAGTCHLMMEMRFEPARDAGGAAIPSRFSRPLVWLLDDPRPFGSSSIRARLTIDGGREKACNVVGGQGPYAAPWTTMGCGIFADVQYFFGNSASASLDAVIEARLDAGDRALLLNEPWPAGEPIAFQEVSFTVNKDGDPSACTTVESRNFGPRGLNNLSPCGGLLSGLWFQNPPRGTPPYKGVMEIRVYKLDETSP